MQAGMQASALVYGRMARTVPLLMAAWLHAHHAALCGCAVQAMLLEARNLRLPNTGEPVRMRVGIHSGPATSGVVGSK